MAANDLTRLFASHAEAMGAVRELEAAGFGPNEILLAETDAAEHAGAAETPGGSQVIVRVEDDERLTRAARILEGRSGKEAGSVLPWEKLGRTAAGGSSGTVVGHAFTGTGPLPGGGSANDLPGTAAADQERAERQGSGGPD